MSTDIARIWDAHAPTFDDEPDHGLRDPQTRAAWRALLAELLPPAPARVADLGCGTGSLSLLLAEEGHQVRGLDVSPAMVELARAKAAAAGHDITFDVRDVSHPGLPGGSFDVVLCRHVVWALPDARDALRRWTDLLAPGGRLVMVEGSWFTGGGLRRDELTELLDPRVEVVRSHALPDPQLWGGPISDERYAVVAQRA